MQYAVACAQEHNYTAAHLWLAIAAELRAGAVPDVEPDPAATAVIHLPKREACVNCGGDLTFTDEAGWTHQPAGQMECPLPPLRDGGRYVATPDYTS